MADNRHAIFVFLPVPSVVASCYILQNLQCNVVHFVAHNLLFSTFCTTLLVYTCISCFLKSSENYRVYKQFDNFFGGDKRDRTADLLNAIQALSRLHRLQTPSTGLKQRFNARAFF